jgi:hypothetical protein
MKNKRFKHYAVFINSFPDNSRSSIADDYDCDFFEVLAKDELEMVTMLDVMIEHGILIDDEYEIGESIDVFDIDNFESNLN